MYHYAGRFINTVACLRLIVPLPSTAKVRYMFVFSRQDGNGFTERGDQSRARMWKKPMLARNV